MKPEEAAAFHYGFALQGAPPRPGLSIWVCVCLCVQDKNSFPTNIYVTSFMRLLVSGPHLLYHHAFKLMGLACKRLFPKG